MNKLTNKDLLHCHRVLASDIEECEILMQGGPADRVTRLTNRIDNDKGVLAKIEKITGRKPKYDFPQKESQI
jgi:hypothetical protein